MELDDVWKMVFATIFGTFVSQVMQQGDCNAPATFQCLMTVMFHDQLGQFIHAYLNDVFAYSNTIEEHEEHLGIVFELLRKFGFYLEIDKCDLYAERMDCLGQDVQDKELEDPMELERGAEVYGPRGVPSTIYAGHLCVYHAIDRNPEERSPIHVEGYP